MSTPKEIAEKTKARLQSYGLFSAQTINAVAKLTQHQASFATYQDFFTAMGVPLKPTLFVNKQGRGVYVVDIAPRKKQKGTLVSFLPMGNSLDQNQLYQTAALASAFPEYRIIAFGNPSAKPFAHRTERLSLGDWLRVAFTKNSQPAVSAELAYLQSQNISNAQYIGYSYGALKALLCARYGDIQPQRLVLLDPVAHARYKKQLLTDFMFTMKPLGEYVNRTGLQTFLDARNDAVSMIDYTKGLARPVNVAIGLMLSRIEVMPFIKNLVEKQPTLRVTLAWGTKSELGNDAHMTAEAHGLSHDVAPGRLQTFRLVGDKHAFANDLALTAAILYESIE